MKTISGDDFLKLLYSNHNSANIPENEAYHKLTIKFKTLLIDFQKINEQSPIFFKNLIFSGNNLEFYNKGIDRKPTLQVDNCEFLTSINFNGNFDDISFRTNIFNGDNFQINNSNIAILDFFNNDDPADKNAKKNIFKTGSLIIQNSTFDSVFWIKNVEFMTNTLITMSSVNFNGLCSIDFISADKLRFYNCNFFKEFKYFCDYNKSEFRKCNFFDLTSFGGLLNMTSSLLWFDNCSFEKLSNFNDYRLHKLRLEDTTFSENVYFQQTYFDIVYFVRTIFEKKAWFDDIQIKKINDCDRVTIRTIKQELQKAENRIDYNKFRSHELTAYYKELNICTNFTDTSILWVTKWSSNFGNSWRRALAFTLLTGFLFFTLFFVFENFYYNFKLSNYKEFLFGYLKFFLITDYRNEYYEAGETILKFNCFLSLFPFILGKIAVAFGIYEMIQSFRKFKA